MHGHVSLSAFMISTHEEAFACLASDFVGALHAQAAWLSHMWRVRRVHVNCKKVRLRKYDRLKKFEIDAVREYSTENDQYPFCSLLCH